MNSSVKSDDGAYSRATFMVYSVNNVMGVYASIKR